MKIILSGTGTSQGVPVIGCTCKVCRSTNPKDNRFRSSAIVEWNKTRLIIDCGPDFRMQMLREKVDFITGIFYTHEHADHTSGLDDIRPLYFRQHKKPISIYGLARVLDNLKERFDYVFTKEKRYPGAPEVSVHYLSPHQKIFIGNKSIEALPVLHGDLPILAYKIENFAYITDAKTLPDSTIQFLKNIELLVINALHKRSHHSHLNLEEALQIIDKIQPKKAVLTHISHHMGLYDEVAKELPPNVALGYDGMVLEI